MSNTYTLDDDGVDAGYAKFPRVHPQWSCKLGERRSPAKNGRGTPFPAFPHNLTTGHYYIYGSYVGSP